MKLIKSESKNKCELGACRNTANFMIKLDRMGIKSTIYACKDCLTELYRAIGAEFIPKSFETAKPKRKNETGEYNG